MHLQEQGAPLYSFVSYKAPFTQKGHLETAIPIARDVRLPLVKNYKENYSNEWEDEF